MMKPKVLPGLAGGHARLALVLLKFYFCHPNVGTWEGMWVEASEVGVAL